MRTSLIMLPLLLFAGGPVAAQSPVPAQPPQKIERELNDPAMIDRVSDAIDALSDALLNLPVGQLQAAVEGRPATAREKRLTMRDVARRDHIDVQRQIAEAKPMIRQSMKALSETLPVVMRSLDDAQKAIERAAANVPDPTYPRR